MTPLTFEQAKKLVPEYIMLNAGDKWARGDEYYQWSCQGWENADDMAEDSMTVIHEQMGRRAIPEEVRDAMAEMVLGINGGYGPKNTDCCMTVGNWLLEQSK